MARVASCPQCNLELLLADGMEMNFWAKCPECRRFFQVKDASTREIPHVLLIDDEAHSAAEESHATDETEWSRKTERLDVRRTYSAASSQTIADFESSTAAAGAEGGEIATRTGDSAETAAAEAADTVDTSERLLESADIPALALPMYAALDTSVSPVASGQEEIARAQPTLIQTMPAEVAPPPSTPNRLEESSDRIDKWFRSAKTLAEDPAASASEVEQYGATWNDPEQIEGLLADVTTPSVGASHREQQERALPGSDEKDESAAKWASEISPKLSMTSGTRPRGKRSALRSITTTVISGVIGVALGYYALFWIVGPSADFLEVAQYLPAAVLPADFQSPANQLAGAGQPSDADADRPEVQTSFEEPVKRDQVASDGEPANARPIDSDETANPPAEFASPDATPLDSGARASKPVALVDAPTFTVDELAVALRAAREAQPGLLAGDLKDGRDVQRAKGFGYSLLCDLARKVAFVDKASRADYSGPLEQDAEALFRETLADQHTRDEVAVIVSKWITSPNRKHGGVFFAGTIASGVNKGSVVECGVELGTGTTLTVLVPQHDAESLTEAADGPVGIVGWIVDRPAAQVTGYMGDTPQAIWVSRLISLK